MRRRFATFLALATGAVVVVLSILFALAQSG
jgi:hypothetical protein